MSPVTRETRLATAYPYVWAWGVELGSYPYYMAAESELAQLDDVPDDVIHRDQWDQIGSHGRHERALAAEAAGQAVILRHPDGTPYRVWYRMSWLTQADPELVARVHRYAANLRAGRPARG